MTIVAIDTSNQALGVALLDENKVIGEYITNLKKNHSIRIMPAIQLLMKDCEKTPKDLSKIIVAKGPGSYTGVRIGVTIAKTLAWSLNLPLSGVSSLAVLASGTSRYFNGVVSPIIDARRGQVYTGLYRFENGRLEAVQQDRLMMIKDWCEQLSGMGKPILFTGSDLALHQSTIEGILGKQALFAEITEHNPRPSELALLGKDKPAEDIHSFVPNYLRLAEAEAKWIAAQSQK